MTIFYHKISFTSIDLVRLIKGQKKKKKKNHKSRERKYLGMTFKGQLFLAK